MVKLVIASHFNQIEETIIAALTSFFNAEATVVDESLYYQELDFGNQFESNES